jgi:hypothetical protein
MNEVSFSIGQDACEASPFGQFTKKWLIPVHYYHVGSPAFHVKAIGNSPNPFIMVGATISAGKYDGFFPEASQLFQALY